MGSDYLMAYGRQLFQFELVLSAMIVVGLTELVIHGLLTIAENHLQRWRPETPRSA
ncbi:hypothetical protein [Mesorhizobium sp. M1399]|uniref:hypothetical protein n=1 Tax=Mesorhizobium sp. M1399 TaxID=2957096 RepID=UPI00333B1481